MIAHLELLLAILGLSLFVLFHISKETKDKYSFISRIKWLCLSLFCFLYSIKFYDNAVKEKYTISAIAFFLISGALMITSIASFINMIFTRKNISDN